LPARILYETFLAYSQRVLRERSVAVNGRLGFALTALIVLLTVLASGPGHARVEVPLPMRREEIPTLAVWTGHHHGPLHVRMVAWADGEVYFLEDPTTRGTHRNSEIPAEAISRAIASRETQEFLTRTAPLGRHFYFNDPAVDVIQVLVDGKLVERTLIHTEPNAEAAQAFREFERYLLSLIPTTESTEGAVRKPPPRFSPYIVQADGSLLDANVSAGTRNPMRIPEPELVLPVPSGPLPPGWRDPAFCKFERVKQKATVQFAAWPDGRVCWSGNADFPGPELSWGVVPPERYDQFLLSTAPDFLAADPSLDFPISLLPQLGPIHVVVEYQGTRIGMRSPHSWAERSGKWFHAADGDVLLGEFTHEEWMAVQPQEYQEARAYWDVVDRAIAALIEEAEPTEPLVTAPVWLLPPPAKPEGRTTSPPILPGSPVPQPAPGP
jgi:hypothetical protein